MKKQLNIDFYLKRSELYASIERYKEKCVYAQNGKR